MLDLLREIAQTLRNNRLRTMLTGIAVAWGIFMLIVLLGAARGVVNSFHANVDESSANTINIWGGVTSEPYKGYKDGRWIQLKGDDAGAIMKDNGNVSSVAAYASVDTAKIITARDYLNDGFRAVYPEAAKSGKVDMAYGRFINYRDISEQRRVMVLHEKNARLLFGDETKAVGNTVSSMGLAWTVVGVYRHRWRSQSYAPYTTYKAITGNNDNAEELMVTVEGMRTEADGEKAEAGIFKSLARQHQFSPTDKNALWTWNKFTSYLRNVAAFGYLDLAVWVIGIFTLLSGIVGVSNIMFVSVRERTHEIGIRRARGAKPSAILTQVLAESVAITALFGYIGIVAGTAILQLVDMMMGDVEGFKNPTVDIAIAQKVTAALILSGAFAGLFPALKAIKVKPVEALRDE